MKNMAKQVKKALPTILAVLGSVGVIGTAYLSGQAAVKAHEELERKSWRRKDEFTQKEKVKLVWKYYIPTVAAGTGTVICILGSNALSIKNQAALTSAYALIERAYKDYTGKVKELYGVETHREILDAIAHEKSSNPPLYAESFCGLSSLDFGSDEEVHLFYDSFSERYFETTISQVLQAEYHLNRNYVLGGEVSLNDFYEFLGLEQTEYGDTVGWGIGNCDGICWLDFDHHRAMLDENLECYIIDMVFPPSAEAYED